VRDSRIARQPIRFPAPELFCARVASPAVNLLDPPSLLVIRSLIFQTCLKLS
jgi:hypothetical protein